MKCCTFSFRKMSKLTRKTYTAEFKAKVALEAVKGKLTVNQIAKTYSVHPNQVSSWKKQLLESLPEIFARSNGNSDKSREELEAHLYQQIGQLKVELDWLKKKAALVS